MSTNNTSTTIPKPITHKQLNKLQIELLQVLYKFRFATADLISEYQGQTTRNSNVRLKNLLGQEYIGRNYDDGYRIRHRPATYYLLPKAVRFLKTNPGLDAKGLHLGYYSRNAKPEFVNHWLRMFRIYMKLDELYGDNLELFTSSELAEQSIYPKVRPDAYLTFSGGHDAYPNCVLDLIESNKPADQIRQKVVRYIAHYEAVAAGDDYPRVLLVCDNSGLERELQRILARTLDYRGMMNLRYYTTTLRALYGLYEASAPIWTNVQKPDESIALASIM
jgi:hypothetical protein